MTDLISFVLWQLMDPNAETLEREVVVFQVEADLDPFLARLEHVLDRPGCKAIFLHFYVLNAPQMPIVSFIVLFFTVNVDVKPSLRFPVRLGYQSQLDVPVDTLF